MLTRLHIENYKAIDSLTLEFRSKNLLMGLNGSGKSSVFEVLAGLKALLIGDQRVDVAFPSNSVPRWLSSSVEVVSQRFVAEFESGVGLLRFELKIEQRRRKSESSISSETLTVDGQDLFSVDRASEFVSAKSDDQEEVALGLRGDRSGLPWAIARNPAARTKLEAFRNRVRDIHVLRVDAKGMKDRYELVETTLEGDLSNFASWYRYALDSGFPGNDELVRRLREAIPGLDRLEQRSLGRGAEVLEAIMAGSPANGSDAPAPDDAGDYHVAFGELSDGQRALIGLYAAIHFLAREGSLLCIDEPDNYLALAEIQPWLSALSELAGDRGGQFILASHHPEALNLFAPDYGIVLERDESGPVVSRRFSVESDSSLSVAELVARGWA